MDVGNSFFVGPEDVGYNFGVVVSGTVIVALAIVVSNIEVVAL